MDTPETDRAELKELAERTDVSTEEMSEMLLFYICNLLVDIKEILLKEK